MMKYILDNDLIIFDLDNTLYNENEYLFEGYENIAKYIESKYNIRFLNTYTFLKNRFLERGRINLFNDMISYFELDENELSSILELLRTYKPKNKFHLFPIMKNFLCEIETSETDYVIITNGNVHQQKNKVENILWGILNPKIVYANLIKPKPYPDSFLDYLSKQNKKYQRSKIMLIGDNEIDNDFATNINCKFVNVKSILK